MSKLCDYRVSFLNRKLALAEMPPTNSRAKAKKTTVRLGDLANNSMTPTTLSPVQQTPNGRISISIHAKPNAKESSIVEVSEDAVELQISAQPKDGEANTELVRFMAETLGLRKSQVSLDKGSKSREKVVLLDSDCGITLETVLKRLKTAEKPRADSRILFSAV